MVSTSSFLSDKSTFRNNCVLRFMFFFNLGCYFYNVFHVPFVRFLKLISYYDSYHLLKEFQVFITYSHYGICHLSGHQI